MVAGLRVAETDRSKVSRLGWPAAIGGGESRIWVRSPGPPDPLVAGDGLLDDVVGPIEAVDGRVHHEQGHDEGAEIARLMPLADPAGAT